MSNSFPIRTAVLGAGSFGRNHLRVYRELEAAGIAQLVAVVEPDATLREDARQQYGIHAFPDVEALLEANRESLDIRAASVAVPTTRHAAIAEALLQAGVDVLVEKPMAASLDESARMIAAAEQHGRILAIGHLERFNPTVTETLERLTRPMFFEVHRLSIFTPRSLDVDVVLDLMIHDLDIILTLARSAVEEVRAVGLPVLSRRVDIANVRLQFASGAVANLTASRVSTEQVRKLRLFQPAQYLSLDYARQQLLAIDVAPELVGQLAAIQAGAMQLPPNTQPHPSAGLSFQTLDLPRQEPLKLEIQDFLAAVRDRTPPKVTGEAGQAALALALEINATIAKHARQHSLDS